MSTDQSFTRPSQPERGDSLLTEKEAAARMKLTARTLQAWRYRGYGPRHVRISRRAIRYRLRDLDDWLRARVRRSTSDPGSHTEA